MDTQKFANFKLRFERSGGSYCVHDYEGGGIFSLAVAEFQSLLSESVAKSQAGRWTPQDAKSFCQRLAEGAFPPEIQASLRSARKKAIALGAPFRLWLELEGAEELDRLPWELLTDPGSANSLSLLRSSSSSICPQDMGTPEPFRILAMVASPLEMPPFDFDWDLAGTEGISIECLEEPNEASLQRALATKHPQVFHFVGYGRSNVSAGYGSLFLEGEGRRPRAMTAEYLAGLLCQRDRSIPSLVVLEAGSSSSEPNPFAETARILSRNGIDSVIAMRRRLSNLAATMFRETLYSSLASGVTIDQSVMSARRALAQHGSQVEWDAPMLYTSAGGGGTISAIYPALAGSSRDFLPVVGKEDTPTLTSDSTAVEVSPAKEPEDYIEGDRLGGDFQPPRRGRLRKVKGKTRKILILAASPEDLALLRLGKEIREIEAGLRRATYRDRFQIEQRSAVRPLDLQQAMIDVDPQIVHFCGHGAGAEGLIFENDDGRSLPVPGSALANLFRLFAGKIECVVLNSCHSETQAKAISEYISYVVGMKKQVGDTAAINFSIGFYCALGAGYPIEFAYQMGRSAIGLENLPDSSVPVLLERASSDPA
jgi:hypothetical protein